MKYRTGDDIKVEDSVLFENGKTKGIIYQVIDNTAAMKDWGLTEKGVMIKNLEFGFVFWPESSFDDLTIIK